MKDSKKINANDVHMVKINQTIEKGKVYSRKSSSYPSHPDVLLILPQQ